MNGSNADFHTILLMQKIDYFVCKCLAFQMFLEKIIYTYTHSPRFKLLICSEPNIAFSHEMLLIHLDFILNISIVICKTEIILIARVRLGFARNFDWRVLANSTVSRNLNRGLYLCVEKDGQRMVRCCYSFCAQTNVCLLHYS